MNQNKKKLLIFSQCHLYGGSERLMQSIYNNSFITEKYDVTFSYSYFKDYQDGLYRDNSGLKLKSKFYPLFLATNGDIFYKINLAVKNKILRKLLKIPLFALEFIGLYAIWNYIYLFIFLMKIRPDVIHINNGGYPAAKACNQLGVILSFYKKSRVIYQINNKSQTGNTFFAKLLDFFINKAVDCFLTHSTQNREALIKRGFNADKVKSIPSFFEEQINDSNALSDIQSKKMYNLAMVGFLSYRKGQMYLLKALLILREINPVLFSNIQLNIVGDGDERFNIENFIKANDLSKNVKLWGTRSDYINFIKACDIFMLTSIEGEDLPLVLLTAMQNSKCVIATNFAGIADLLTNNFDSILLDPNAQTLSEDIAKSLNELLPNSIKRNEFSINIKKTFNDKLGIEKYSNNLLEIYSS